MSVKRLVAGYGATAGTLLAVAGAVLLSEQGRATGFDVVAVAQVALVLAAALFAVRIALVAVDPDGVLDAGIEPPTTFEVSVVTRSDLWKPVAFDLLGVVVSLALVVTTPVIPSTV